MRRRSALFAYHLGLSILLAACGAATAGVAQPTPTTVVASSATAAILAPSETATPAVVSQEGWREYRDLRYGYGLAIPCYWTIYPTAMEGMQAAMTAYSYSEEFFAANSERGQWKDGTWPPGAMKMDVIGFEGLDPTLSLSEAVHHIFETIAAGNQIIELQEITIGQHAAVQVRTVGKTPPSSEDIYAVSYFLPKPGTVMSIIFYPNTAIDTPDAQAILGSFSASPDEPVSYPAIEPNGPPDGGSPTCE